MCERCEQLEARVRELEPFKAVLSLAQDETFKAMARARNAEESLLASQAYAARLREALETLHKYVPNYMAGDGECCYVPYGDDEDPTHAESCPIGILEKALCFPTDPTAALDEHDEKVRREVVDAIKAGFHDAEYEVEPWVLDILDRAARVAGEEPHD